tara:strand:+ start:446 stop:676 length:231 start_codon:yes stop_codon:yes gene_type:complete
MSQKMTGKEMIDSLLSANGEIRRQLKDLQEDVDFKKSLIAIALSGLYAIEKYGNSQEIASKTLSQIEDLENNVNKQ